MAKIVHGSAGRQGTGAPGGALVMLKKMNNFSLAFSFGFCF